MKKREIFEKVEQAWSADALLYNQGIQNQLARRRDVEHWKTELTRVLGKEPRKVLDVGCGPGFFTVLLSSLGHDVTAMDGAPGMVECARNNVEQLGKKARVYLGDAVKLEEEKEESFDVILSRDVVWTLYSPEEAFCRWKALLKEGGCVVIYDGDYRRDNSSLRYKVLKGISDLVKKVTEKGKAKPNHASTENGFDQLPMTKNPRPSHDKELLEKTGFSRVEVTADRFRNTPFRMEFWKYGYQGKKFRVIAQK